MGLFDKFKNIFTEEVEEEVEIPVKKEVYVKKEVPKVEIPASSSLKKDVIKREEIKQEEDPIKASNLSLKKEEKFVFPVYFDDKDFEDIKKEEPKPVKKVEPAPAKEQKRGNYQEAYSKINKEPEERKVFKPTPIISPVYGILDKNYYKEDIVVSKPISRSAYTSSKEITIDDVRKKAFGTLEDDLENTLLSDENLNSKPKHASIDDENNSNSDIFDEMDFANAIEEDRKRDMTKDGLKSDIESLLNNKEFMEEFNYHLSSVKNDINAIKENEFEKREDKFDKEIDDDDVTIDDLYEKNKENTYEVENQDLEDEIDYSTNKNVDVDEELEEETTVEDLYEENKDDFNKTEDEIIPDEDLSDAQSDLSHDESDETLDDLYDVKENISDESDDEIDNAYNSASDLNDSDLFNLIDSMYDKENK